MNHAFELDVFYDGLCPLCAKEIDMYRNKDLDHKINFIDISASEFSATAEGLDAEALHKTFHVRDRNGELHTGVGGFTAIWKTLGIFNIGVALSDSKITRPVMDLGYAFFSKIRPYLPKKDCDTGACKI